MSEIIFGAMVPSLKEQGIRAKNLEHYQLDADTITRLNLRGVLTDSEALKARKRIIKALEEPQ